MAAVHLENLLTTRFARADLQSLAWEHQVLVDLVATDDKPADAETRLKIGELKMRLAQANQMFYDRHFREAIDEYKLVQGLVWALIQPQFNPDLSTDPGLIFPLDPEIFDQLLGVSVELVAVIEPKEPWWGIVEPPGPLPEEIKRGMAPYTGLGVEIVDGVGPEVRHITVAGVEAATRGDWAHATRLFSAGLDALGRTRTPEAAAARASLQMNLGVAALQAGNLDEAGPLLERAAASFADAGDAIGQAQVALNLAATLTKAGDEAGAAEHLETASTLVPERIGRPERIERLRSPAASRFMGAASPLTETNVVSDVASLKGAAVMLRMPTVAGWTARPIETVDGDVQAALEKQLRIKAGTSDIVVEWAQGEQIPVAEIRAGLYEKRVTATDLAFVNFDYDLDTDLAAKLPQLYYFALPVAIADCHHELGEHALALKGYGDAAMFQFLNRAFELPALWIKVAQNYLAWGDLLYREGEPQAAVDVYSNVITPDDKVLPGSPLYSGELAPYGDKVKPLVADVGNPGPVALNPKTKAIVLGVRNKLRMIAAGLDFFGNTANHFPIFKFDYLQSIATYFAQQAVQAEREYVNFTSRGEDEQLTREQLSNSVEISKAQVDLAQKQVDQAVEERDVTKENMDLANLRVQNAQQQRQQYANVSYELTALEAASVFASGPEGYSVNYTYYSPSEGKNVTLSGSDAYKVMEDAAWRRGMLSREMELSNMDRNIAELQENQQMALQQHQASQARVDVAVEQKKVAQMSQQHAEELLGAFESQLFTPEIWFQLGKHLKWISDQYLERAIGVARKMQQAYALETGFSLTTIKSSYTTNVLSGLLSANYLLLDIDYFTIHRINNTKAKDVPIKQQLSLAALNPIAFETTFKKAGRLEFETGAPDFDRAYPGSYLRKIKKVEVVVEGLLPPGGIHGTLKNSGISRDRKRDGTTFFRVQPRETLYVSQYSPRTDAVIFTPDQRVLDVFEHCGVATGWTLDLPPDANDVDYRTISDVKVILYYTAQHSEVLETQVKAALPKTGQRSTSVPFRLLFPDEFFAFVDTGTLGFELSEADFAHNEKSLKVRGLAVRAVTYPGTSSQGIVVGLSQGATSATATTDAQGAVKSDPAQAANPLNKFAGKAVAAPWTLTVSDAANPGIDRSQIRDLFLFLEYDFTYRV